MKMISKKTNSLTREIISIALILTVMIAIPLVFSMNVSAESVNVALNKRAYSFNCAGTDPRVSNVNVLIDGNTHRDEAFLDNFSVDTMGWSKPIHIL